MLSWLSRESNHVLCRKVLKLPFGGSFPGLLQRCSCRFHNIAVEKNTVDRGEVAKFSAIGKGRLQIVILCCHQQNVTGDEQDGGTETER